MGEIRFLPEVNRGNMELPSPGNVKTINGKRKDNLFTAFLTVDCTYEVQKMNSVAVVEHDGQADLSLADCQQIETTFIELVGEKIKHGLWICSVNDNLEVTEAVFMSLKKFMLGPSASLIKSWMKPRIVASKIMKFDCECGMTNEIAVFLHPNEVPFDAAGFPCRFCDRTVTVEIDL